jgi:hypothetical protein
MEATENLSFTEESKSQNVPPKVSENPSSTEESKSQNVPPKVAVGDLHDVYKGFKTSINVVQKAALILEEEVAAGIIAAKKVEDHFVDTEKLRYGRPEEVMSRFRLDAHEVLDIMVDLVNVTMNSMYSISKNAIKIRSSSNKTRSEQMGFGQLPVITPPHAIKAGYSCEIPLSLENSGDKQTDEFQLYCTELVSASGERILASKISFTPSSLKIDQHSSEKIIVTINVPEETKTGVYSGLVSATSLSQLRSIITIPID